MRFPEQRFRPTAYTCGHYIEDYLSHFKLSWIARKRAGASHDDAPRILRVNGICWLDNRKPTYRKTGDMWGTLA